MKRPGPLLLIAVGALFLVPAGCIKKRPQKAPENLTTEARSERGRPAPAMPGVNVPAIKVNTVGYPAHWKKVAIFNVDPKGAVILASDGATVRALRADEMGTPRRDVASGDLVWQVEIKNLDRVGRFRLRAGKHESDWFTIFEGGYGRALMAAQKHYYFQRTRTALVEPFASFEGTSYLRAGISHAHDDVGWDLTSYPKKEKRFQLDAGWHDAGNYDMYVPSTAPTAQALLMAFEHAPGLFEDRDLNIPESGNGVPDILDEARYGIRWVLSMQEPESGAFRHREAVMQWSPSEPPDHDRSERWVAGRSTSATAKAVALLALAARVYRPVDQAFSQRCKLAAEAGYGFLVAHPEHIRVDGKGSPQPLWDDEEGRTDRPARFIAAVEMWRSFQQAKMLPDIRAHLAEQHTLPEEFKQGAWANLSRWGLLALLEDGRAPKDVVRVAKARLLAVAEEFKTRVTKTDGYRSATPVDGYYWGHNSNLAEKGHLLAALGELVKSEPLIESARDQLHWLLGRNPNGFSMVTRVGRGPDRIYHGEWGRRTPPPPGYLVGGPNAVQMKMLSPDAPAKALLWDNPFQLRSGLPPHSLWHQEQSDLWDAGFLEENEWQNGWWAVTEPDIYYNANLVLLLTYLAPMHEKKVVPELTHSPSNVSPSAAAAAPDDAATENSGSQHTASQP